MLVSPHTTKMCLKQILPLYFCQVFCVFVFVSRLTWLKFEDRYDQSGSKNSFQKPRWPRTPKKQPVFVSESFRFYTWKFQKTNRPLPSHPWFQWRQTRNNNTCWWFRNPANQPVEVGSLSTTIYKSLYIFRWWLFGISEASTVSSRNMAFFFNSRSLQEWVHDSLHLLHGCVSASGFGRILQRRHRNMDFLHLLICVWKNFLGATGHFSIHKNCYRHIDA